MQTLWKKLNDTQEIDNYNKRNNNKDIDRIGFNQMPFF